MKLKIKQVLDRMMEWMEDGRRFWKRGMYNGRDDLSLAVGFSSLRREIDGSNGVRLSLSSEACKAENDVGLSKFILLKNSTIC